MMDRRTLLVSLRPVSLLALGLEVDANGTGGPHMVSCNEGEAVACVASGPAPDVALWAYADVVPQRGSLLVLKNEQGCRATKARSVSCAL